MAVTCRSGCRSGGVAPPPPPRPRPARGGRRGGEEGGERVDRGAPLADRLRDPRTEVVSVPPGSEGVEPGAFWARPPGRRRSAGVERGELLFRSGGRWRIGAGEQQEPLEAPFAGIVDEVRPGVGVRLRS